MDAAFSPDTIRRFRERALQAPCVTWDGDGNGLDIRVIVIKPDMSKDDWAQVEMTARSLLAQATSN